MPGLAQTVDDATRSAARNLGASGVEAYQSGDYAVASDKLDKAYRTLNAPSLGLWSARAFVKIGRLIEAAERYQEVQRLEISSGDQTVQRQAKADASSELAQLAPRIPNIVVSVKGVDAAQVNVTIDGVPLVAALLGEKRPVNPGKHQIQASNAGQTERAEVELAAGETKPVTLKFRHARRPSEPPAPIVAPVAPQDSAAPGRPSSTQRTLGFVALGVGGAGVVLGGIATGVALGKKSTLGESGHCDANRCLPSEQAAVDSYATWRTVSTAGLIGGAALLATGAVLVLSAPAQSTSLALRVGPTAITLTRTF